jgi:steroid delta-isomerase-like uncharacterized protein
MGSATARLRERMVRDAVVDVLRGLFEPAGDGPVAAPVDQGHVGEVSVNGSGAAVRLLLPPGSPTVAADRLAEAARRLQSLPELHHFELTAIWDRQPAQRQTVPEKGATMPTEQQTRIIERYTTDVWSKGDLDAVGEIFTADRVRHGPDLEGTSEGAAGHRDLVALYRTSLPDLSLTVEAQVGEGDTVVTRWRATGTNLGPTLGIPPTGQSCDVFGFWMHRFEGDQIAEEWAVWDTHGFLQQMGVSLA